MISEYTPRSILLLLLSYYTIHNTPRGVYNNIVEFLLIVDKTRLAPPFGRLASARTFSLLLSDSGTKTYRRQGLGNYILLYAFCLFLCGGLVVVVVGVPRHRASKQHSVFAPVHRLVGSGAGG